MECDRRAARVLARSARLLHGAARWALVAILVTAGARKLLDPPAFADVLSATGFFSNAAVPLLARAVPLTEIAAATCLAVLRTEFVGLVAALFLSAAFAGLHGYLYFHGILVPCGCGGLREGPVGETYHLIAGLVCVFMFLAAGCLTGFPAVGRRASRASPAH